MHHTTVRDDIVAWYRRVRWYSVPPLFILLSLPICLIPQRLVPPLGGMTGTLLYYLLGRNRRTAVLNIANTFPFFACHPLWNNAWGTPEQIARRAFANFGRSLFEAVKIYYGLGWPILEAVEFRGLENYRKAREKGKGVIFVTGHCGNWEVLALSFGARIDRLAVVGNFQRSAYVSGLLQKLRRNFGNRIIHKEGAVREIISAVRRQENVGILVDQSVQPSEGVVMDFLGRGAWIATIPARIAEKTGVPLMPTFIHREGGRHVVTFHPQLDFHHGDIVEMTREISRSIENQIVQHPDEWLWVYRRWKRAAENAPAKCEAPEVKGDFIAPETNRPPISAE